MYSGYVLYEVIQFLVMSKSGDAFVTKAKMQQKFVAPRLRYTRKQILLNELK